MLPHVIVALDFGTEFTKARYAILPQNERPPYDVETMIWPITSDHLLPTVVTKMDNYSLYGTEAISAGQDMFFKSTFVSFKLDLLDGKSQTFALGDRATSTPTSVNDLVSDFLREVFRMMKGAIEPILRKWHSITWDAARIHLVMSKPAGTKGDNDDQHDYIMRLQDAVKNAGFVRDVHALVTANMTECEAAAYYAIHHPAGTDTNVYKNGETCILVDVGGGTADLFTFHIDDIHHTKFSSPGRVPVRGVNIGGVQINKLAEIDFRAYLRENPHVLRANVDAADAACALAWGPSFPELKLDAGQKEFPIDASRAAEADGPSVKFYTGDKLFANNATAVAKNGLTLRDSTFIASSSFLTGFLEHQVFGDRKPTSSGILGLIGNAIDNVYVSGRKPPNPLSYKQLEDEIHSEGYLPHPAEPMKVDHIILTGGFASLHGVRTAIAAALRRDSQVSPDKTSGHQKYRNVAIDCVRGTDEPQLCVVVGLLDAYIARLTNPDLSDEGGKKPKLVSLTRFRELRHKISSSFKSKPT